MGGSSGGTSKQISEPWEGQKGYLSQIYNTAAGLGNDINTVSPYPGQSVGDFSDNTNAALARTWEYGANPTAYTQQAQSSLGNIAGGGMVNSYRAYNPELANTASGAYLNAGNPYLQGAINSAINPLTTQFKEQVMPSLDARFAMGGRYGSQAGHAAAANNAASNYMQQVGNIASNMSYQNYGDERARQEAAAGQLAGLYGQERSNQMQAIGMAPGMQQADLQRLGLLGSVGQTIDAKQQQYLDAAKNQYLETRDAPWELLSRYNAMITGAGTPGYTTTSTGGGGGNSAALGALGGALSGAGVGATFGPWGALIGAGVGAAGGYAASR